MSYGNAIALSIQSLDSSLSGQLIDRDFRLFAIRSRDLEKISIAFAIHSFDLLQLVCYNNFQSSNQAFPFFTNDTRHILASSKGGTE